MNLRAQSLAREGAPAHVSSSHSSRYLETRNRYSALTVEEPDEHQDTSIDREPFETRDTVSNHESDEHQESPLNPHEFETEGNQGSPSNRSSPKKTPDLGTPTGTSMPEVSNVTVLNDGLSDLLRVHGRVNGHKALILLDSGSTHDFVSEDFVRRHHLETQTGDDVFTVTLADGTTNTRPHVSTKPLHLTLPDLGEEQTFSVFPLSRYDVILGKPWLTKNNPTVNYRTNEVKIGDSQPWVARLALDTHSQVETCIPDVQLNFISGQQARHALRRGDQGFLAYVTADESVPRSQNELDLQSMIQASPDVVQRDRLLSLLNEYQDVFPETLPAKLPPVRQVNHEIDLEAGSKAPSRAPYRLSQPQLDELQAQLTVLLEKGLIEPSKSPFGAPVFFVKKSDGSLRLVCDWRELNRITIKNEACLPNIDDLFDTIQGSKFFTKLDLHSGYNQVRV